MGIQIEFPKNFERYVDMGQKAMKERNFAQAAEYFLKAYEIEQDFPLNFLIANTLFDIGEYKQALNLAKEFEEDYHSHLEYFSFYIQLLALNRQFIEAHREINTRIYEGEENEMEELVRLKKEVRHNELLFRQFERKKIEELKNEISLLPEKEYFQQMIEVKKMSLLTQEDFLEVARNFLANENVQILVRSWILEMLVVMGVQEEMEFLWVDKSVQKIKPNETTLPYQTKSYQQVFQELDELLGQNDPILMVNLMEEVRIFFAVIFPLSDSIITNPEVWAKSFLVDFWGEYDLIQEVEELQKEILEKSQWRRGVLLGMDSV
ncbi:hypothetical protein SAMN02745116_00979 [Pilibacter termitis]|uniref:Tetratricopeptide repeat-containing protein n=1 Tax=Pilibacter termitis TaxID=263852 RepID=A0A1T4M7B7_9ENTE|nr:tetratricopeptide repeat protein [Pilibacter termitis]SJZ62688.1 hypothetical protein SAMN02745116_00979 [Pilibacter termitis]